MTVAGTAAGTAGDTPAESAAWTAPINNPLISRFMFSLNGYTYFNVLALLAPFIHKADLVVLPVQSIVLALDPFLLAFANFLHGLSHLRDTHCCTHACVFMLLCTCI